MTEFSIPASKAFSPAFGKWRWLCLALAGLATLGLVLSPLFSIMAALFPDALPFKAHGSFPYTGAVPMAYRVGVLLCDMVPTGLGMWGLWSMRQLFLGYAGGAVFTKAALRHLNHIALALLLGEIAGLLMLAPETLLVTWTAGPGRRALSLGFGSSDAGNLFLAGAAFIIARIMAEAQRIAADHAEII